MIKQKGNVFGNIDRFGKASIITTISLQNVFANYVRSQLLHKEILRLHSLVTTIRNYCILVSRLVSQGMCQSQYNLGDSWVLYAWVEYVNFALWKFNRRSHALAIGPLTSGTKGWNACRSKCNSRHNWTIWLLLVITSIAFLRIPRPGDIILYRMWLTTCRYKAFIS